MPARFTRTHCSAANKTRWKGRQCDLCNVYFRVDRVMVELNVPRRLTGNHRLVYCDDCLADAAGVPRRERRELLEETRERERERQLEALRERVSRKIGAA